MAINHACTNVKLMAISAKLLNDTDYTALIRASTLKDVYTYLKEKTIYSQFMDNINPEDLHRANIEVLLSKLIVFEIEKMLHYVQNEERAYLLTLSLKMDIEFIRVIIRGLARGEDITELKKYRLYVGKRSLISEDALDKVKKWDDFKRMFQNTEIYRIFDIHKDLSNNDDLFLMEKSLERFYYDKLKHNLEKLDKNANKELIQVMRKNFDLLNLVWFYRGKRFYHLTREELIAYSLKGGLYVKDKDIEILSSAKNIDQFLDLVKTYKEYDFIFNHNKTLDLYMERRKERYLYYANRRLFYGKDAGFNKIASFIQLLYTELYDVTAILESKRYKMSEFETKQFIIRSIN